MTFKDPFEFAVQASEAAAPAGARRLRINQSDLDAHEYIDGCPQCEHSKCFGKIRPGGNHSERCRTLITEAIRANEAGRARLFEREMRTASAEVAQEEFWEKRNSATNAWRKSRRKAKKRLPLENDVSWAAAMKKFIQAVEDEKRRQPPVSKLLVLERSKPKRNTHRAQAAGTAAV